MRQVKRTLLCLILERGERITSSICLSEDNIFVCSPLFATLHWISFLTHLCVTVEIQKAVIFSVLSLQGNISVFTVSNITLTLSFFLRRANGEQQGRTDGRTNSWQWHTQTTELQPYHVLHTKTALSAIVLTGTQGQYYVQVFIARYLLSGHLMAIELQKLYSRDSKTMINGDKVRNFEGDGYVLFQHTTPRWTDQEILRHSQSEELTAVPRFKLGTFLNKSQKCCSSDLSSALSK
jgi:hypothetical protein